MVEFSILTREIGFKPCVGQINTTCNWLNTDANLRCVFWRKLRQWDALTHYTLTGTKDENNKNLIFDFLNKKIFRLQIQSFHIIFLQISLLV